MCSLAGVKYSSNMINRLVWPALSPSVSYSESGFTNLSHLCCARSKPKHQWHNLSVHFNLLITTLHIFLNILKEKILVPHPRSWILKWKRALKYLSWKTHHHHQQIFNIYGRFPQILKTLKGMCSILFLSKTNFCLGFI